MIRILIADDSVAIRGFLRKTITAQDGMEVVGTATNGRTAVEEYLKLKPDLVLMDCEMPEMDGLAALEHILKHDKSARVMMCSSLTQDNADITIRALAIGAVDYIGKPTTSSVFSTPEAFQAQLIEKITSLCAKKISATPTSSIPAKSSPSILSGPFTLRPAPMLFQKADILAIGSSTGGLQALFNVLVPLKDRLNIPVVITQHMPASFTQMLAMHIAQKTNIPTHEAAENMLIEPGHIYVAPGDFHLELIRDGQSVRAHLSNAPPENFCRPSVDPMFRSILKSYSKNIIAVILTGMGSDGLEGSRLIVESGHNNILIAQDEATSTVWGMPGAVAKAGLCHAVLPLDNIGPKILGYMR
jgi:two-component system chemotaxis response regulator CheB